jgi:hypothetical protein
VAGEDIVPSGTVPIFHRFSGQMLSYVMASISGTAKMQSVGVGVMLMQYQLKFINSIEQTVRELKFEADDEDAAIDYSSRQSILFDMHVELWRGEDLIVRTTPMTARLYLPDDRVPRLSGHKASASAR